MAIAVAAMDVHYLPVLFDLQTRDCTPMKRSIEVVPVSNQSIKRFDKMGNAMLVNVQIIGNKMQNSI